jgi:sugar phosphate isomerase/epimerase
MYPGAGQIDFSKVISALRKIGYEGYLTAEVVPKPSDEVAAQMSIKNIKTFLL